MARLITLGEGWPDTIKRDKFYFEQRHAILDIRGPLFIAANSHWGQFITVITQSHEFGHGELSHPVDRPVIVKDWAWIGARAFLYNCIIGECSVVAAGSVVRSCEVAPNVIVAGNPAKVVARWKDGWEWLEPKWKILA